MVASPEEAPAVVHDDAAAIRNLQYAFDHPPHQLLVEGESFFVTDPEGEHDFAVNFNGDNNTSTLEGHSIADVVEAAARSDNTVTVELYVRSVNRVNEQLFQDGDTVTLEDVPEDLPFLQGRVWSVGVLGDDPADVEYALSTEVSLDDLQY